MGFFSKLKNLVVHKKTVSKQIKEKNEENSQIEQKKFDQGLYRSSSLLNESINNILKKKRKLDDELIAEIEETLIKFDIGTKSTQKILDAIVDEIKIQNVDDPELIKQIIVDKLFVYYIQDTDINTDINIKNDKLNVILVTGVNGVGKTTTIAKLANRFISQKKSVLLIAGDTFRAGAVAQLAT
jgi:fused signal recognition particle receptor